MRRACVFSKICVAGKRVFWYVMSLLEISCGIFFFAVFSCAFAACLACRLFGRFCAFNNEDKFAARGVFLKMVEHLGDSASDGFLVQLGDFTSFRHAALRSESLDKLRQGFHHTVGRFIENHGALFCL